MHTTLQQRGARDSLTGFLTRGYSGLLGWMNMVSAAFIFVLMLIVSGDVIGRYVFSRPLWGTLEAAESILVFVVFLGFGYTQFQKGNIRVQILSSRLPLRGRMVLDLLTNVLGLAMFALITYETCSHAILAYQIGEESVGMVRVPLWPSRFAIPLGCFFLATQFTIDAWDSLRKLFSR